jgi:hypothetical protein
MVHLDVGAGIADEAADRFCLSESHLKCKQPGPKPHATIGD